MKSAYVIVQQATGQAPKIEPRLGGLKGGEAHAQSLTPIAKKAADAR